MLITFICLHTNNSIKIKSLAYKMVLKIVNKEIKIWWKEMV